MTALIKLANSTEFDTEELRDALLDICTEENSEYIAAMGITAVDSAIIRMFESTQEFAVLFDFQDCRYGYHEDNGSSILVPLNKDCYESLKDWAGCFDDLPEVFHDLV